MTMPNPTIHVTKCVIFQFQVLNSAGQVDSTTPATPGASNTSVLRVRINPANPREAAAVALSTNLSTATAVITANGHTASQAFDILPAPDLSQTSITTVDAESDPPSWAL